MEPELPPLWDDMSDPLPPAARIRRAIRQMEEAGRRRDQAIRDMRDEGATLRQIAEVAGMTHTGIRKILTRATDAPDPEP